MNVVERSKSAMASNVRRLGHIDLPGAGQVCVAGSHAYVGHIPNKDHLGTSIVDISDPANPRVVATITLDDQTSHSHKARVVGDIMIVNHERNPTAIGRRADELPRVLKELTAAKGRAPTHAEIATWLGVEPQDVAEIEAEAKRGYTMGGFKVYDVSNPAKPKEIAHHKTGGIGVHRFDMDERYAYISTEMAGYVGNILVIYDMRDPAKPQEVSRWWMPGSTSPAARRRPGSAASTGCIMRCASATRCGRAAGTAASASSTCPTCRSRRPKAATTITRCSRSRRTPRCRCRKRSTASASRSRSTRKTRRRAPTKNRCAAAGRMPAS